MIKINALGTKIPATDEGLEINPPSYRTMGETASIQSAFDAGDWEPVPDPLPPPPEPDWTAFNTAMLSNVEWQSWKALLPNDLVVALISASVIGKEDAFHSAYELGKSLAPPTLTQTQNWQSVADQCAIPIVF